MLRDGSPCHTEEPEARACRGARASRSVWAILLAVLQENTPPLAFPAEPYHSVHMEQMSTKRPTKISITFAVIGGFTLSFTVLFFVLLSPFGTLFRADLLTEAPFNLAMHNQILASATLELVSFWFWAFVIALGVLFSWWLLKVFRG